MIIPVSIFIIYVDLYLLIELIMNKKIKNKTGITITPLYNRSLQISGIYLGRIFFSRVERPFPNWIYTIVENYFRFFGLSTNSKCHIRIGFSKEIIISFAHLKIVIFQSDLRTMAGNESLRRTILECFLSLWILKQIHAIFLQAYEIEFRKLNYPKMEYQYDLVSLYWFSRLFNLNYWRLYVENEPS